jgi:hypothetical protein
MKKFLILGLICFSLYSCKTGGSKEEEQQDTVVSVKAERLVQGNIPTELSFNGSTVYLKKSPVVSPISGYITKVNARYGDEVRRNDVLFEIQTRESQALEGDSSIRNFGIIRVTAVSEGFIDDITVNATGVFVSEGGSLCNIVNSRDLMIRVNVPFEYNSIMKRGKKCSIYLSDNSFISGSVTGILPVMDQENQTQTILIRPDTGRQLPENMNVIIKFAGESPRDKAFLVSKSALMTNETQSEFWIMKIDSGNIAVKVPVLKSLANDSIAEIMSSRLRLNDLVISEGAYGLPDSTVVKIAE